jgi:hypothetical protein
VAILTSVGVEVVGEVVTKSVNTGVKREGAVEAACALKAPWAEGAVEAVEALAEAVEVDAKLVIGVVEPRGPP